MIPKNTLRLTTTALLVLALLPAFAAPVNADHDGSDEPHHCDPCQPTLTVTGGRDPGAVDNPWGLDPLYLGWTVIDLQLPDDPKCRCFVEGWDVKWSTAVDHAPFGTSAGIDVTQVDADTWIVHNLDADIYEITFIVHVYCNGEHYPVTTTYYQLN